MQHRLMDRAFAGLTATAVLAAAGTAFAGPAGYLDCSPTERPGLLLGAGDAVDCRWLSPNGTAKSYYGLVKVTGIDLKATSHAAFAWTVIASPSTAPETLDGGYEAIPSAKGLVGGPGDTVALSPANIMSQTSVNLAGSVTSLKLKAK